jgi:hypothetical protein
MKASLCFYAVSSSLTRPKRDACYYLVPMHRLQEIDDGKITKQHYANKLKPQKDILQHLSCKIYSSQIHPMQGKIKRGYYLLTITSYYLLFSIAFLGQH